ncbi:hypothetical protein JCM19237_5840 [Photobacterium aphoticum]|uniref:LA2681-like HEPN domain-containing protein n=1 Tax=Photobacterium aphoticum TaxID=754436 RepID=A0A090R5Q0_9GAMM|nr:hypothetical protein JCM19237_5840 [Photobacterium aphoticum]
MKCKIYTNLANKLDSIGRHVAAIEYYDHALELIPRLIMASGNKSHCLYSYGAKLYDEHHADIFCRFSHKELINATTSGAVWDSGIDEKAKTLFKQRLDYMESMFNNEPDQYNYNDWPLGETSEEVKYRTWSMENKLFLNPLNDIMVLPIVTTDVLHLPNHNYHISETTARFSNYFNTIKQEYITSRYMLFKSIHEPNRHFIDDEVLLLNGFDGVYFGYKEELLKTSYRLTYSIFDKISYFINDYMCVGLNERDVSFNKIWGKYDKNEKRFVLREPFASSDNDILRGLYFLSKELFDTMFVNFSDPDAKELDTIRHMIEHKSLQLKGMGTNLLG